MVFYFAFYRKGLNFGSRCIMKRTMKNLICEKNEKEKEKKNNTK